MQLPLLFVLLVLVIRLFVSTFVSSLFFFLFASLLFSFPYDLSDLLLFSNQILPSFFTSVFWFETEMAIRLDLHFNLHK